MIHFHLAQQGARGSIVIQRSYNRLIKDNIELAQVFNELVNYQ